MTERTTFGAELRRAREGRKLSLETIAEQTKVSATLFAGLERGDLSRWPPGIFRRGFVRSYALAVGLDPEATVSRFSQLFHDPTDESKPSKAPMVAKPVEPAAPQAALVPEPAAVEEEPGFRLALEQARSARTAASADVARRLLSGSLDISIALMPAALVALVAGVPWFWPVAVCVAMAGHLACYTALGTTPGEWLTRRLAPKPPAASARIERRRPEADLGVAPRRHVPRHQSARPAPHVHRTRH